MSILDRYILKSMCVNYFIALGVMLSLYVLLDMFINLDEFTERDPTLPVLLGNLADYYGPNLTLYFAQLSGVIATFACLLTLARLRVQNELTAILASGVSLYRVAVPIVVFGVGTAGLLVLDTEVLVPALAPKLVRAHDEVGRAGQRQVLFMPDRDGALLSASRFTLDTEELHNLLVITRDDQGMATRILDASLATYEPPASPGAPGRWLLQRGRERAWTYADDAGLGPRSSFHERFPLEYVSDLSPRDIEIRQRKGWVRYLSLIQLRELQDKQVANLATIVQTRHQRVAAPILSIVLLLLGLPFFLDRSPASILSDASWALLACGGCYVVTFCTENLRPDSLSALPAWIPIFVFATLAVVLLDRLRT